MGSEKRIKRCSNYGRAMQWPPFYRQATLSLFPSTLATALPLPLSQGKFTSFPHFILFPNHNRFRVSFSLLSFVLCLKFMLISNLWNSNLCVDFMFGNGGFSNNYLTCFHLGQAGYENNFLTLSKLFEIAMIFQVFNFPECYLHRFHNKDFEDRNCKPT